jgi:hypothetical protein
MTLTVDPMSIACTEHRTTPRAGRPRSIAFYLPQFHPIPENDRWWGAGFTEWRNVVRARPRFRDHYQPHLPGELGFYDLRLPETRVAQADLARAHGIDAFCYYHYWFEGKRLLERPFSEVLASGEPDFPFTLCWANEHWTRTWSGGTGAMLMRQTYSEADDRAHIRSLLPAFADSRYVRVEGKLLFIVYRASSLPDPRRTADLWRHEVERAGLGELHLCRVEGARTEKADPSALGFDSSIDFQPDWSRARPALWKLALRRVGRGARLLRHDTPLHTVLDYGRFVDRVLAARDSGWTRFPCVTPSWDNSARRDHGAVILQDSSPARYGQWVEGALRTSPGLLFVNAWNEWAEGAHLEPCERWGRAYLEAHRDAVVRTASRAGVR